MNNDYLFYNTLKGLRKTKNPFKGKIPVKTEIYTCIYFWLWPSWLHYKTRLNSKPCIILWQCTQNQYPKYKPILASAEKKDKVKSKTNFLNNVYSHQHVNLSFGPYYYLLMRSIVVMALQLKSRCSDKLHRWSLLI